MEIVFVATLVGLTLLIGVLAVGFREYLFSIYRGIPSRVTEDVQFLGFVARNQRKHLTHSAKPEGLPLFSVVLFAKDSLILVDRDYSNFTRLQYRAFTGWQIDDSFWSIQLRVPHDRAGRLLFSNGVNIFRLSVMKVSSPGLNPEGLLSYEQDLLLELVNSNRTKL